MTTIKGNFNLIDTLAYGELKRVKSSSAFNVQGATDKRKVNQHLSIYHFNDGSDLEIYSTSQIGVISCPTINGYMSMPIKTNKQGK